MAQQPLGGPRPPHCSRLRDHTFGHTSLGRTPLDEWPALHSDLYLTTDNIHKRDIHAPGGIRTHNPSKLAAVDPRLRPRGHWDRWHCLIVIKKRSERTFFFLLPNCRRSISFWKVPRLRPFVLLVRATCRWRWVWSIGGMILTGEKQRTGKKNLFVCLPEWAGIEPGPRRWQAGN
jgi:hypothetical protein